MWHAVQSRCASSSPAWAGLREKLREEYHELQAAVEDAALASESSLGGAIGVVAHAAYHLAHIRQRANEAKV